MAEKEFLLGNKAADLMAYTFTATKPVSDKTVEARDVIRIMEYAGTLPEEKRAPYIDATISSLRKQGGKEGFPKSAVHTYVKDIREAALAITRNIEAANGCNFETDYEDRLEYIKRTLAECRLLLRLIQTSQKMGYVSIKRMGHWTKMVTDVLYMTASWKKKDGERARKLRAATKAREGKYFAEVVAKAVRETMSHK